MNQTRTIVMIDEEKCNGCGLCVPTCHEGAIQIIDGVARLVADKLCDGLGDCLGQCPLDAITIIERQADAYDDLAVQEHLLAIRGEVSPQPCSGGCPGSRVVNLAKDRNSSASAELESHLCNWPVQLHLIPVTAPYFQGRDLLVCADCVPFAHATFHSSILQERAVVIACPKLDQVQSYAAKLAEIIATNNIKKLIVAHMEVPCCSGLVAIVSQAIDLSSCPVELEDIIITIDGKHR